MFSLLLCYLRIGLLFGLLLIATSALAYLTSRDHQFLEEEDIYDEILNNPTAFTLVLMLYIALWPYYMITNFIAALSRLFK